MLERGDFDDAIDALVAELADSRLCIQEKPARFEDRVLEVARLYGKGVTNIMGHVYQQVEASPRFNPTRKQRILQALQQRGVGSREPALRRF